MAELKLKTVFRPDGHTAPLKDGTVKPRTFEIEYEDVPVYHITGWYDSWTAQAANLSYAALSKAKKGPHKLIIGPWVHGGQGDTNAGEAEFGPASVIHLPAFRSVPCSRMMWNCSGLRILRHSASLWVTG